MIVIWILLRCGLQVFQTKRVLLKRFGFGEIRVFAGDPV